MSEDPAKFYGRMNWYAYVNNSPLRFRDPSGLCPPKKCNDPETLRRLITQTMAAGINPRSGEAERFTLTYDQTVRRLRDAGFDRFRTNINPQHWLGDDLEGVLNGNWYHIIVGQPYTEWEDAGMTGGHSFDPNRLPPFLEAHCEPNQPSSWKHLRDDFIMPKFWWIVTKAIF